MFLQPVARELRPQHNQLQTFFCNTSQGRLQECQGYGQPRPDQTLNQRRQFSGSLNATCVGPESRFPTFKNWLRHMTQTLEILAESSRIQEVEQHLSFPSAFQETVRFHCEQISDLQSNSQHEAEQIFRFHWVSHRIIRVQIRGEELCRLVFVDHRAEVHRVHVYKMQGGMYFFCNYKMQSISLISGSENNSKPVLQNNAPEDKK